MNKIKHLSISKLHGNQDIDIEFNEGLNIIHGKNGTGKTTIANVVANLLSGDTLRLIHLNFEKN